MNYKICWQGMTVFDLSKKSRPPPGKILPMSMNTQINRILLTIPIRLSAFFCRRAYCISPKNSFRNFVKSQSFWACVVLRVYERGHQKKSPAFAAAKGGEKHE